MPIGRRGFPGASGLVVGTVPWLLLSFVSAQQSRAACCVALSAVWWSVWFRSGRSGVCSVIPAVAGCFGPYSCAFLLCRRSACGPAFRLGVCLGGLLLLFALLHLFPPLRLFVTPTCKHRMIAATPIPTITSLCTTRSPIDHTPPFRVGLVGPSHSCSERAKRLGRAHPLLQHVVLVSRAVSYTHLTLPTKA